MILRCASWNIQSNANPDFDPRAVAAVLANQNPHVAALQEVRRDRLEQVLDCLRDRNWPTMAAHLFAVRNLSAVRRSAKDYGPALLARVPLSNITHRVLPEVQSGKRTGALRAIAAPPGARPVYVYSAHMNPGQEVAGVDQVKPLFGFCSEGSSPRKVIMGDFNIVHNDPRLYIFHEQWASAGGDFPTFPSDAPEAKIDFCFTSLPVVRATVPHCTVSDHRPLVVELQA